jgi:hypothetical protein
VLSPKLKGDFVVDNTQYDTTSIMATIEQRFALRPVSSRDAAVNSMFDVFAVRPPRHIKRAHRSGHHRQHRPRALQKS